MDRKKILPVFSKAALSVAVILLVLLSLFTSPASAAGPHAPAANHAPVLDTSDNLTFTAITEDPASNPGTLVSTLLASGASGDPITDADPGAQEGIAITATGAGSDHGTWQFTLDGGALWSDLGTPSTTSARLLLADASTRLRFVPELNFGGIASLTFRAWDATSGTAGGTLNTSLFLPSGSFSLANTTALLEITSVNDAPVLTASIATQNISEDGATAELPFSIADVDNLIDDLGVTATSSNPAIVPNDHIALSGGGTEYTVKVTPDHNQSDSVVITLTVTDPDGASDTYPFTVHIAAVNDLPEINFAGDQSVQEDHTTPAYLVAIRDVETPAASLGLSAASNNQTLIPDANLSLGGSDANRTITLTPAPNQYGQAEITLTVTDGSGASATTSFILYVNSVNDLPTVSAISDQTSDEDVPLLVNFTIGDVETPAGSLSVTCTSEDQALISNANLVLGGSGENRTLTLTPLANRSGSTYIHLTITDANNGKAYRAFKFSVYPVNDLPTISTVSDQTILEDSATSTLAFTVGDIETPVANLIVTAASSDTTLVPDANITLGGADANRTVRVAPAHNQFGTAEITLTVRDGSGATRDSTFLVKVLPINDPPTITSIPNQLINVNGTTPSLAFTVGDVETAPGSLVVTGTSSDPTLVPDLRVVLGGSGPNRTVIIRPMPNESGTTTITLSVSDGEISIPTSFTLTVNALPTLSTIPDQILARNTSTSLAFTVGDAETAPGSLGISVSSSNPTLIPNANLVLGGTGANRTLQVTPIVGQMGTATITLTASDGMGGSASTSFNLTVTIIVLRAIPSGGISSGVCGSTWETGCTLQHAIELANSDYEIWVKTGTYVPGATRDSTFNLKNGVRVYGGFAGNESTRNQRNWSTYPTILSGEISGNNICHVITASNLDSSTTLDGFTISGGAAELDDMICGTWNGGGMQVYMSDMLLANLVVRDNTAAVYGSGIFLSGGSPRLFNVVVRNNTGGPLSSAVYVNGATPILTNTTFWQNVTGLWASASAQVTIQNSIFWGNTSSAVRWEGGTGGVSLDHSLIQGGCPAMVTCNIVISSDPLFGNPATGDLRLAPGSAAIDAGDNSLAPLDTYDLDGDNNTSEAYPYDGAASARFVDHPIATPVGEIIDMGAYETGLNTAPVFNFSANQALSALYEDPASNPGILLTTLLNPSYLGDLVTDPDPGAVEGIAVTLADNSFGQWQYSLDGSTWTDFGTPDATNARLLPADSTTRLRFAPGANLSGTAILRFLAWDRTSGTSGGTADVTVNGGTTAFSSTVNWVNQSVFSVEDAPTISPIADLSTPKNTATPALAFTIDDADSPIASLTVSATSSNGTLVPDGNISLGGSGASRTITVTPASNRSGAAAITISVSDGENTTTASFTLTVIMVPLRVSADPGALSSGTCSTWETACTLTYALSAASLGDELWVKSGTYVPGSARSSTFNLINGIRILGGFDGTENAYNQRNWPQNETVLSGEDNVCHIVSAIDLIFAADSGNPPLLDGFTIRNGSARGDECGSPRSIFPSGGGIFSVMSDLRLSNLIFRNNSADSGGGIALYGGDSVELFNVVFSHNVANFGGGMMSYSVTATLTNTTFYANGHLGLGVIFGANLAIRNSIFWDNNAAIGSMWVDEFSSNSISLSYSLSQNGCDGTTACSNLIAANPNPLFGDPTNGDLRLGVGSPAIDVGNNSFIPADSYDLDADDNRSEPAPYDAIGAARIYDYPAASGGAVVDLGAYEASANTAPVLDDRGSPTLTGISEDPASNPGTTVATLLATGYNGDPISDPDPGLLDSIAVTAVENTNGKWQYSLNGSTWSDFGSPGPTSARLLPSSASLRFVPNANTSGSVALTFRAWDRTSGSAGGTADSTINGGTTAFSLATESASLTVSPVNDPPANTVSPAISGSFAYGSALSATSGSWNDTRDGGGTTITYAYQWQRANDIDDADEGLFGDIPGATASTYTLTLADNRRYLRVRVTASDDGYPGSAAASADSAYTGGTFAAPALVSVDDNFSAATPGWGYDHFAAIQSGLNAAAAGGTVNVAAGSYSESVNLAANLTLNLADTVSLTGSLTQSNGTLNAPAQLSLSGNWVCTAGTFNHRGGLVTFSLAGTQSLTPCGPFYDLTVGGASTTLVLLADLDVEHHILVNSGSHLDLGAHTLNLSPNGQGLTTSTVQALNAPGSALFLGASGVSLDPLSDLLPLGATTVSITDLPVGSACPGFKTSLARCFSITPANPGGRSASLRFYFQPHDLNGLACSQLRVFHSSDGLTGWSPLPNPTTRNCAAAPYWVEISAVSDFSSFTLSHNGPNAANVSPLAAVPQAGHNLRLTWNVLNDAGLAGFNLYRREGTTGEFVRLNPTPITLPTEGWGPCAWLDPTAQPGHTYEYRLEIILASGQKVWAGAIILEVPPYQVYAPLVGR